MTFDQDVSKPKRDLSNFALGLAIFGIVMVGVLFAFITYTVYNTPSIPNDPRPATINTTFSDTNQTRAELIEIIQNQRVAVYSSYATDHAYCLTKVDKDSLARADKVVQKVEKTTVWQEITCYMKNGNSLTYNVQFDYLTNEFKESVKLSLPEA